MSLQGFGDNAGFNKPFGKATSYQQPNESRVPAAGRKDDNQISKIDLGQTPRRLEVLTNNNSVLKESSMIFMSKLHFKPFIFGKCNEKLNQQLLDNTRVEQIEYTGELDSAQTQLRNFAFSDFNTELVENMGYFNFVKLFRLWQLAILNYGSRQKQEQSQGEKKYAKYRELLEASQKIDELKKNHAQKKTKLYEIIKTLQWQVNELKTLSNSKAKFKCTYCEKTFSSTEQINSHIKESHKQQIEEIKSDKEVLDNLGNPTKVLTKREERKIQEANTLIADKVARELEQKMGEQLRRLAEAQEEIKQKQLQQSMMKKGNENLKQNVQIQDSQMSENKRELAGSIVKMNSTFGGFEEMLAQMQSRQVTLLEEQNLQKKRLQEIEMEQKKLDQERERQNKQLQEQSRGQQYKLDFTNIRNEEDYQGQSGKAGLKENWFATANDPSFGNNANANLDGNYQQQQYHPSGASLHRANSRKKFDGAYLEEVEEDTGEIKIPGGLNSTSQLKSPESNFTSEKNTGHSYLGKLGLNSSSDNFSRSRSNLKKQFESKYANEVVIQEEEKNKLKRLQHIGDMESDYDSDLFEEEEYEQPQEMEEGDEDDELNEMYEARDRKRKKKSDVLIPINQHQMLKNAELQFKQKLMSQREVSEVEKNLEYKMASLRKEQISKQGNKQSHFLMENNKMMSNYAPAEIERRKNQRLIEEVLEMNDQNLRNLEEEDEEEMIMAQQQKSILSQQVDIMKMKKQFLRDTLSFDLKDDGDIMNLDEQQFYLLKKNFISKYDPNEGNDNQ